MPTNKATTVTLIVLALLQGGCDADSDPVAPRHLDSNGAPHATAAGGTTQAAAAGKPAGDHGSLTGLLDDDHPQYLLANGVRNSANGFVITGELNQGSLAAVPENKNLVLFDAGKGAFRAGFSWHNSWAPDSLGTYSAAFGYTSVASGTMSFAAAQGHATGESAFAIGGRASGHNTVAIGEGAVADAYGSMAFGNGQAHTNGKEGAFVFADRSSGLAVNATVDNQFVVRAQHVWFGTNNSPTGLLGRFLETSTGAYLSAGGTWTNSSDSTRKTGFEDVEGETLLARLSGLPIRTWSYREEDPTIRHMGPTAQQFRAAFGLGQTETDIATVDADGVALAAAKALEERTSRDARRLDALAAQLDRQQEEIRFLRAMVEELLQERLARLR